jgi:CRP-like cAMP-binding protein
MDGMCRAAHNLLRQLSSEGMVYRLSATGGTATTLHLRVQALTPEVEDRIAHCLSGMGAVVEIEDASGTALRS